MKLVDRLTRFKRKYWDLDVIRKSDKVTLLIGGGSVLGFLWGNHPFSWNFRTTRLIYVTNPLHHAMRKASLFISVIFVLAQTFSLIYDISTGNFTFTSIHGMYRILSVLFCTFPTVFQLNTSVMPREILEFSNHSLEYFEIMKKEIFRSRAHVVKFDLKCAIIMFLVMTQFFGTQCVGMAAFSLDCKFHPLSSLLPICEPPESYKGQWFFVGHKSRYIFVPSFILLYFVTTQLVCASSAYMAMLICPVFGCKEVLAKMQ